SENLNRSESAVRPGEERSTVLHQIKQKLVGMWPYSKLAELRLEIAEKSGRIAELEAKLARYRAAGLPDEGEYEHREGCFVFPVSPEVFCCQRCFVMEAKRHPTYPDAGGAFLVCSVCDDRVPTGGILGRLRPSPRHIVPT
ncbi:MAG: hypothetical protein ACR2PG_20060, partial [Hyphomicrobiaceae bacterium]